MVSDFIMQPKASGAQVVMCDAAGRWQFPYRSGLYIIYFGLFIVRKQYSVCAVSCRNHERRYIVDARACLSQLFMVPKKSAYEVLRLPLKEASIQILVSKNSRPSQDNLST